MTGFNPFDGSPAGSQQEVIDRVEAMLEDAEKEFFKACASGKVEACDCPDPECPGKNEANIKDAQAKAEVALVFPYPPEIVRLMWTITQALSGGEAPVAAIATRTLLPKQGEPERLDRMYGLIGDNCHAIDLVTGIRSSKGRLYMMVVDDEGLLCDNPKAKENPMACIIAGKTLVGNVIFVRDHEGEDLDPRAKAAAIDYRNAVLSNPDLN